MTPRRYSISTLLLTLILAFGAQADVTSLSATVDKNPAMADESITLTVTANGDADRNDFDPSPLLKDFVVGRTSVSSQTRMVNFDTTRSTTWSTILIPRAPGRYTIPAFTVDGKSSQPIVVMVVPVSANKAAQGRDLYITTEVDNEQVYLQQQIRYTVKLHLALDLQRGSLEAPKLDNAEVRQIGKDKEYTDLVNGKRYRIIERTFAIIPQQSGRFTVNGPLFQGEVLDNSRQSFGFFNRTKTVNRVGPAIDIEVLPIPADFNSHWLPSEFVQLNEEWQPANGQYIAGEPITRTITLTAVGLVEEQLPEIAGQYPTDLKTYPDQASTTTVEKDQTLIAQRVESVAIIPGKAGEVIIPPVKLPWFNVTTGQTEFATLPARTIQIAAANVESQPQLPVQMPQGEVTGSAPALSADDNPAQVTAPVFTSWWSMSSWVFLGLWLATLLAWRLHAGRRPAAVIVSPQEQSEEQAWKRLKSSFSSNDSQTIVPQLTSWLAIICGDEGLSLPSSQKKLNNQALNEQISAMFAARYSRGVNSWQSNKLQDELNLLREQRRNNGSNRYGLNHLYPQATNT